MPIPKKIDLENMKQDIDDLEQIVNSVESTDVTTRLGKVHKSLTGRMNDLQAQLDAKDAEGQAALATAKDKLARYAAINYTGDFVASTAYAANDVWKDPADDTLWIVPADYTSGATAQADIDAKVVRPHQDRDRVDSVDTIADLRELEPSYHNQKIIISGDNSGFVYISNYSNFEDDDGLNTIVTTQGKRWVISNASSYLKIKNKKQSGILYVGSIGDDISRMTFDGFAGKKSYIGRFADIATAITYARPGDNIIVLPGGYSANFTIKEGVSIHCMRGVFLYDPIIQSTSVNHIRFTGDAEVFVTDSNSTPIILTDCDDYIVEIGSINVITTTGNSRAGIKAVRSSGRIEIKRKSLTNSKQILTIDNEWNAEKKHTDIVHAGLVSNKPDAAMSNNDYQIIGVFNGADVDVYSNGNINSVANNAICVGAITAPSSADITVCRLRGSAAKIEASGGFLMRGDSGLLSTAVIEVESNLRIRTSEFARSGGTPSTNNVIKFFGSVHSTQPVSAIDTVIGSLTVSAEA